MIVRPKPNLIGVLTSLKGSIAKRIAWRSLMVTLLASAIVLIETLHPSYFSKVSATPFTLLGLSLRVSPAGIRGDSRVWARQSRH